MDISWASLSHRRPRGGGHTPSQDGTIPEPRFHKDWQQQVATWFKQRTWQIHRGRAQRAKAHRNQPHPASGPIRPIAGCPPPGEASHRSPAGRGFCPEGLRVPGIPEKVAQTIGIWPSASKKAEQVHLVPADKLCGRTRPATLLTSRATPTRNVHTHRARALPENCRVFSSLHMACAKAQLFGIQGPR